MRQKITLEIDNDTGVEFEGRAVERCLAVGDYYISAPFAISRWEGPPTAGTFLALTPKVDKELEEAKRKFPVGSYYTTTERMSGVFAKVESVERVELRDENRVCVITSDICSTVESCTPFPLPVWRCCVSDKPKKEGNYFLRSKNSNKKTISFYQNNDIWVLNKGEISASLGWENHKNYEWLDEGGE